MKESNKAQKKLAEPPQEFLGPLGGEPKETRIAGGALIDEFIDALWLADGLAKNTLAAYRSDLALFALWLAGRGTDLPVATEADIDSYLAHLHARAQKVRPATLRRLQAALRRYYREIGRASWRATM